MILLRDHATDWGMDPAMIGVLGFSSGAFLAAAHSRRCGSRP
ncbi:MAG TPA: hypothetical protein VGC40_12715 [Paenirhodobacter sp.]